jgi:lipopolysaccharide transport system ATP-binding protein
MSESAVSVEGLGKKFRLYHERNQSIKSALIRRKISTHEDFWALRDISFEVPVGSTFALIGSNGSGKSTLLKCLANILWPDEGKITSKGRVASLLEVGSGFHPELSGRENIYLNGSILGMSRKEVDQKFDSIVDFSEIEKFIDQPVKSYSSGMYVRLGFSVAIHVQPDILVVDEILAVGDAAFQAKSRAKFDELHEQGKTVILVSHSHGAVMENVVGQYIASAFPVAPELSQSASADQLSALGWPSTPSISVKDQGGGVAQRFQHGVLYWSKVLGVTAVVSDPIDNFFDAIGGVDVLGWPAEDAQRDGRGGYSQNFQRGRVEISADGVPRLTPHD